PVYHDVERKQTKVWAFLGWNRTVLQVSYATEPVVVTCEPEEPSEARPRFEFRGERHESATPVFAEVLVEEVQDRDAFRRFCDEHQTHEAILAALGVAVGGNGEVDD